MMARFSRPAEASKYVLADDRVLELNSIVAGDIKAPEYFPENGDAVSGTSRVLNVSIQALGVGFSFTSGKHDLTGPLDSAALDETFSKDYVYTGRKSARREEDYNYLPGGCP
jgi:hypothetical protein